MKRLQILLLIFCVTLSVPLGYFVWQTYRGLVQEETATLRFFASTLLDEIEQALQILVQREEGRVIDEYNFYISPPGFSQGSGEGSRSPLSDLPAESYILGYFQNNPDGSFQTPLVQAGQGKDIGGLDGVQALLAQADRATGMRQRLCRARAMPTPEKDQAAR